MFTPWTFDFRLDLAAALVSGVALCLMLGSGKPLLASYLLYGGIFYVSFLAVAVYTAFA